LTNSAGTEVVLEDIVLILFLAEIVHSYESDVMFSLEFLILAPLLVFDGLLDTVSGICLVANWQAHLRNRQQIAKTELASAVSYAVAPSYAFQDCSWSCKVSSWMERHVCEQGLLDVLVDIVTTLFLWQCGLSLDLSNNILTLSIIN